jgi:maleylpyruvate isomerase
MRTREVWIHAVDLDNGARFTDFPDIVLESLLTDIVGTWRKKGLGRNLMIEMTGAARVAVGDDVTNPRIVRRVWALSHGSVPPPPPWL